MPAPETLYLIDGHGQIFRAYFAIRGGMNSPITGEPTNAVFGFAGMLLKFFLTCRPSHAVMAIDLPGKTFRDEIYPQYKANRPPAPADLHAQERRIFALTRLFGIPMLGVPGAEADDVIATLTTRAVAHPGLSVRIVSKDKDLEQLLSDRVTMFDIHTDTTLDPRKLLEEKGITPEQVVEVLALMGDSVDNVPGVPGVGPKTAAQLIHEYGTIDNLLAHIGDLKGKRRENLEKAKDVLDLSRRLVALKRDLDIPADLDQLRIAPPDAAGLRHFFEEMGFRRHQQDLDRFLRQAGESQPAGVMGRQGSAAVLSQRSAPSLGAESSQCSLFGEPSSAGAPPNGETSQSKAGNPNPGISPPAARNYYAVTTPAQLDALIATLRGQKVIALDTETIGLSHRAPVCGLSLAWEEGHAVYLPLRSPDPAGHLPPEVTLAALKPILGDPEVGKTGHNIKYDWLVLRHAGVEVRGILFDSMIASHLLGAPAHGLDDLALSLLNHRMMQISALIGAEHGPGPSGGAQRTMDQVPLELITRYAADDAEVSLRLYHHMSPQLRILGMEKLAAEVEMPLVEVLADMEYRGITVDPRILDQQKAALVARIDAVRADIHRLVGHDFNLDSPRQLAQVLFEELKLPVLKRTKTGQSTDAETLDKLADRDDVTGKQVQILEKITEYRQLTKLVSTYLDALKGAIQPPHPRQAGREAGGLAVAGGSAGEDASAAPPERAASAVTKEKAEAQGTLFALHPAEPAASSSLTPSPLPLAPASAGRVHAQFHQTGAATGRLSSSDPNLQNIPVRTEIGRQVRRAFVAAPGSLLVCADYSQIELRILAHLSGDANLIDAFIRDQDIHAAVAAQVFNTPLDHVTKEMRAHAKVINFGIVYGVTPFGLARRIEGLTVEAARQLIGDYRRRFSGIGTFLDQCVHQAEQLGYVTTIMNRRRPIPQLKSSNASQRSLGERLAINSVAQGSAADLIKLAMVNLYRRFQRESLPAAILLQIHDELVVETPQEQAGRIKGIVKAEMEGAMQLRVPLKVDAGCGPDWLTAKGD